MLLLSGCPVVAGPYVTFSFPFFTLLVVPLLSYSIFFLIRTFSRSLYRVFSPNLLIDMVMDVYDILYVCTYECGYVGSVLKALPSILT